MKLSLWMVANRLRAMEPVTELEETAPVSLNSARLAYATNCVHVYQEENDVVCKGEGGSLRFIGMDLRTGFEVMQSVFDFFQDWETELQTLIREERFQEAVELGWQVLQNPLVLLDGNNRVMGMTRQYGEDALDAEWRYLCRYGYSSMDAVRQLRSHREGEGHLAEGSRPVSCGNITLPLTWGDVRCGRITLIAGERPLNPGDRQIMELLSGLLRPALAQMFFQNEENSTADVFLNLLLDKPYGDEQLSARLRYTSWSFEDSYYVTLLRLSGSEREADFGAQRILRILSETLPGTVTLKNGPDLPIISTRSLRDDPRAMELLQGLRENNPLKAGFSMKGKSLRSLSGLYTQAQYAIRRGGEKDGGESFFDFFPVAGDYMLESPLSMAVGAVSPQIEELWNAGRRGDDLVNTLCIYLYNNCSAVRTAAELYIHRNTVLYRVQKAEEMLGLDFHELYDRSYFLSAIRLLELRELRKAEE